jgi:polyisoprenoid-binding protein YceI
MATWTIDPTHSEIGFVARHLVITKVRGHFAEYQGIVSSSDEHLNDLAISFEANVASISTKNSDRDNHLKSADFFDADNHPKLTFVSTSAKRHGNALEVSGLMSIRGVEKPVSLNVEVGGVAKDPWGNTKAGLSFAGSINRKDFGLAFHVLNEAGDLLVSDEIKLEGEVQLKLEA